jgi:UDP-4-amino-4-deoxy-L-arabinose formyltransferase/UDP-glucuronic acid dehydrogenase (UDP-4-keto-hexauronic acid decarboxylating)
VLVNGETETGVTLHRMVRRADAGAIVAQQKVAIDADETRCNCITNCARGANLLRDALPAIQNGTFSETAQDESKASCFGRRTRKMVVWTGTNLRASCTTWCVP